MDNSDVKTIRDIWTLAQNGGRTAAINEVINLLRGQPDLIPAWLLLAELLNEPQDKAQCYQKVLALDAHNKQALQSLEHLSNQPADFSALDRNRSIPDLFADDEQSPLTTNVTAESDDIEVELDDEEIYEDDTGDDSLTTVDGLTLYVIQELGGHADPDDIILEVCLRGGMDWNQAEAFVREITSKHARTIAKKRSPLLLFIAIPTFLAGIVWFLYILAIIVMSSDTLLDTAFSLLRGYGHLIGSVAMMLGGSLGIYRVLKSLGKIG